MPEGRKRARDGDALGGGNNLTDALAEATATIRTLKRRIVVLENEQESMKALFVQERNAANECRLGLERTIVAAQARANDLACAVNLVVNTSVHEMRDDFACKDEAFSILQSHTPEELLSTDNWMSLGDWNAKRSQTLSSVLRRVMEQAVDHTGVKADSLETRMTNMLAIALAAVYCGASAAASFPWGKLMSLFVKARTASRVVGLLVSKLIPGALDPSTLTRWYGKLAEKSAETKVVIPSNVNVLVGFDNVGKGAYKGFKTARHAAKSPTAPPIVTNAFYAKLRTPSGPDNASMAQKLRFWQNSDVHSPVNWRHLNAIPPEIMEVSTRRREGELRSEQEELDAVSMELITAAIDSSLKFIEDPSEGGAWACNVPETLTIEEISKGVVEPTAEIKIPVYKYCTYCYKEGFEPKEKSCDECNDPCRDYRPGELCSLERARRLALFRTPPTETQFPERAKRSVSQASDSSSMTSVAIGRGIGGSIKEEHTTSNTPPTRNSNAINNVSDAFYEYVPLPVMLYNPGKAANQLAILKDLLSYAGVQGFTRLNETPSRKWVLICSDLGAALTEADMPACVHSVAALGHEEQTYFNCLASLVYVSTFNDLAALTPHSRSEAAKTAFKENWENHKTFQIITLLGRVVARVLAIEFVIAHKRRPTSEEFVAWLKSHPHDQKFTLFADLYVLNAIPNLLAFRTGLRSNNPRRISAARKRLAPLLAARGHRKYAPAIVRDTVVTEYQCTDEVRAVLEFFRTWRGQGHDFKLEEHNSKLKANLGQDSARGWRAASVITNCGQDIFNKAFSCLGLPKAFEESPPESRVDPTLTQVEDDMTKALLCTRALKPTPRDTPRAPCTILNETRLNTTLSKIYDVGNKAIDEYLDKLRLINGPRLEERIKFSCEYIALNKDEERAQTTDERLLKKASILTTEQLRKVLALKEQLQLDLDEDDAGDTGDAEAPL